MSRVVVYPNTPEPSKQRSLGIRAGDAFSPEPLLQHPVPGINELDDDQLMTVGPARHDHLPNIGSGNVDPIPPV